MMKRAAADVNTLLVKRSLALGRSRFRPGKRSAGSEESVNEDVLQGVEAMAEEAEERLAEEDSMGKRSMLMGREGGRPGKRSLALGRSGFRPGKRSIALGRKDFRPGKRFASLYEKPLIIYAVRVLPWT